MIAQNRAHTNGASCNDTPIHIRSIRTTRWLWIDNAIYDRYATALGLEGLGLYLALARYANNQTAQCWPSMTRLAAEIGADLFTLESALERLIAAGLLAVTHDTRRGTVLTLLDVNQLPAPAPPPEVASTGAREELNSEQERNTPESCSSSFTKKNIDMNTKYSSGFSSERKLTSAPDETSSWAKPPVAWTAARPDTVLEAATLAPDDYVQLAHQATTALLAEGLKAFCLTRPVIEARMTVLLEQRVTVAPALDGCEHEHVEEETGVCKDCGEMLARIAE